MINDDEGKLFCVRAPENSDAGTIPITISLEDNRPSNPLSTEFSFDLELIENDAPEFTNLGNFPNTISVGDTIYFDVEWQDPNSDAIDFSVTENYSWFIWDNSGNIKWLQQVHMLVNMRFHLTLVMVAILPPL